MWMRKNDDISKGRKRLAILKKDGRGGLDGVSWICDRMRDTNKGTQKARKARKRERERKGKTGEGGGMNKSVIW